MGDPAGGSPRFFLRFHSAFDQNDCVCVFLNRRIGRLERQPPRHSQVDVEPVAIVEGEDDALAATGQVGDGAGNEMVGQIEAFWREDVGAEVRNRQNPGPNQAGTQGVDNGLHFREFGHETFLGGGGLLLGRVSILAHCSLSAGR